MSIRSGGSAETVMFPPRMAARSCSTMLFCRKLRSTAVTVAMASGLLIARPPFRDLR